MKKRKDDGLIFAIKTGSIRSGFCVMTSRREFIEGGLILPDKFKAPASVRIGEQCEGLRELLGRWMPRIVLVEWPGRVGRPRHRGSGPYLSIYYVALGSLWREIVYWRKSQQLEVKVVLVDEGKWTDCVCKLGRTKVISGMFSKYDRSKDPGMEISDAVGLCVWYIRDCKIRSGEFDKE